MVDFQSLCNGNPFYILRQGSNMPQLEVGTVKSKTQARANFQTSTPNIMSGIPQQQVLDIVVSVNGRDETIQGVPTNIEIAQRGNVTFTGSKEAMLQAIDGMIQKAKGEIEREAYNRSVILEGEKMVETLNPRYAEEKRQARTISELEKRQTETDKKLDSILSILKKLDSPS